MNTTTIFPALLLAVASLSACANPDTNAKADAAVLPTDLGPKHYDASGVLKCSAASASYDQACGFRVLRKTGGDAEIWIANIATPKDQVRYRVLYFAHGEFTTRDDARLDYHRDSDSWVLNADGNEFYQIPDAVIEGG